MENKYEKIPLKIHPRAFAALGMDLVTNDVVAIIELVKNSYDAFAKEVWIRFGKDENQNQFLEIQDTGQGMTKKILEDVWSMVATPYKEKNKIIKVGNKERRVTGEKGLGRLSAARLGGHLKMLTKSANKSTLELLADWDDVSKQNELKYAYVQIRELPGDKTFDEWGQGTLLKITDLKNEWGDPEFDDLEENLSRLLLPFADISDFSIVLYTDSQKSSKEIKIALPKILTEPIYLIKGSVTEKGKIIYDYKYEGLTGEKRKNNNRTLDWSQICESEDDKTKRKKLESQNNITCGSFEFEIRAWDLDAEGTEKLSTKFDMKKNKIRSAIRAHKGISIYRDNVLVLPKSEEARDWLGLDIRRVSKVGTRLSTSQIMGHIIITLDENPKIKDTSDRENLASNQESKKFRRLLMEIVKILENERHIDRSKVEDNKPTLDLFDELDVSKDIETMREMAEEGASASDVLASAEKITEKIDRARKKLQENFTYYSQLATIGSIALMLVHEIGNRTTSIGYLLEKVRSKYFQSMSEKEKEALQSAEDSVNSLDSLARSFSPLAHKKYAKRGATSPIRERIVSSLSYYQTELHRKKIEVILPKEELIVETESADLDTIIINLLLNSIYWLSTIRSDEKKILFKIKEINDKFAEITVSDSGPGIEKEEEEKVFMPGVTRKPGGMGMGLTVASELIVRYGGKIKVNGHGKLGGATFAFTLPLSKK